MDKGFSAWCRSLAQGVVTRPMFGPQTKISVDLQIASLNSFLCSLGLKIVYLPTRNKCDVIFYKVVRMTTDKR